MNLKTIKNWLLASTIVIALPASALEHYSNDSAYRCDVDPVILQLDSMYNSLFTRDKFFVADDELLQSINMTPDMLPSYTSVEIAERLKTVPSMIPMTYNKEVKACIDMFAMKKRGLMTRCLANSQIYFPLFEEVLDKEGLPIELKYLPIVESAFNPNAVSRAGATGLWQIMHGTARMLGLEINSYVDERRDPGKATVAAVKFLKMLYSMYGDWHLVLAAYNSGPGNVNKAIARSGGKRDFWSIMYYLPAETRSYVPLFIAATYVMHYHDDYKLKSAKPNRDLYAIDTVMIESKVSLKHISNVLGIPVDELMFLNPALKAGIVPRLDKGYPLNLPINYFALYESRKVEALSDPTVLDPEYVMSSVAVSRWVTHKVRSGETIGKVAGRYGVTTSEIKKWNRLKSTTLQKGQKLKVQVWERKERYEPTYSSSTASVSKTVITPSASAIQESMEVENATVDTSDTDEESAEESVETAPSSKATATISSESTKIATSTSKANAPKIDSKCNCVYHVVQRGDTLWNIAERYAGITVTKLRSDNRIPSNRPIKVGDVLKIYL